MSFEAIQAMAHGEQVVAEIQRVTGGLGTGFRALVDRLTGPRR